MTESYRSTLPELFHTSSLQEHVARVVTEEHVARVVTQEFPTGACCQSCYTAVRYRSTLPESLHTSSLQEHDARVIQEFVTGARCKCVIQEVRYAGVRYRSTL